MFRGYKEEKVRKGEYGGEGDVLLVQDILL